MVLATMIRKSVVYSVRLIVVLIYIALAGSCATYLLAPSPESMALVMMMLVIAGGALVLSALYARFIHDDTDTETDAPGTVSADS